MSTLFDKYTHDLTPDEVRLVPGMITAFNGHIGPEEAITSKEICAAYKERGIKMTGARVRKLVNHLRMTGKVERLVASSVGYYISNNPTELADYIKSLVDRAASIKAVADQLSNQARKLRPNE